MAQEKQPPFITLDKGLEADVYRRFNDLVDKGEILWAPYHSERIEDRGFKAVFQLAPHLRKKPIQASDAPERKTGGGDNPFVNPNPDFVVAYVGPHHTLLLNKYCVYNPSLILHTNKFAMQSSDLDASDLLAAWSVLKHFKEPLFMIYNCGIEAGSSQGHKHMQFWPYPSIDEVGFDLFPSQATSTTDIASNLKNVPHKHFALKLGSDTTAADVTKAYSRLLIEIDRCHKQYGSAAYNVAMALGWLCLIPRRSSGADRGTGSNGAGPLGLVWISTEEEKDIWRDPSLADFMAHIGVPN